MMENLAAIATASRWCDDYKVDKEGAANLAVAAKLPLGKEPYKSFYQSKMKDFEGIVGKHGVNAYCEVAFKRYGPGGEAGVTLIMKK